MRAWAAQVRLRHWAHFLVLPLAGADRALPHGSVVLAAARGVAISFAILAFGYLLNSLADRDTDLDPEKRVLPRGPLRAQRIATAAFGVTAIALALCAPWPVLLATLGCLASGWVYSVGPRLKALPVIGSALNITNFAPLLFVGLARPEPPPAMGLLAACFTALLFQNQLLHEAADAEEDARGRVHTTFLRLGPRGTAALAALAGAVLSWIVWRWAGAAGASWLSGALAVPFLFVFPIELRRRGHLPGWMRHARLAHRWLALVAGALLYVWLYWAPR